MKVEEDSFLQKAFIKVYGRPVILKRIHIIFIIIVIIYQILIQFTNLITLALTAAQVYPVTPAVFNGTINSTIFGVTNVIVYNLDNYFYASVLAFAVFVMTIFAIDAVIQENPAQLFSFYVLFIIVIIRVVFALLYNVINVGANHLPVSYIQWEYSAAFIITVVFGIYFFFIWYFLYRSFGQVAVSFIGIEKSVLDVYRRYQYFVSSLLLDAVITVIFGMLVTFYTYPAYLPPVVDFCVLCFVYPILWILIIATWLLVPMAILFAKKELIIGLLIWILFSLILPCYAIVIIIQEWTWGAYSTWNKQTILSVLSFVFIMWRLFTFAICVVCMIGFGRGLKERFYSLSTTAEGPRVLGKRANSNNSNSSNSSINIHASSDVIFD